MEHALHLSVGHLVKELGLTSTNATKDDSDADDEEEEEAASDVAEALNKALGLTKQVFGFIFEF